MIEPILKHSKKLIFKVDARQLSELHSPYWKFATEFKSRGRIEIESFEEWISDCQALICYTKGPMCCFLVTCRILEPEQRENFHRLHILPHHEQVILDIEKILKEEEVEVSYNQKE